MLVARLLVLLLSCTLADPASDALSGAWHLKFLGPKATMPICCSEVVMNLVVSGTQVTGTVTMGDWPGIAPITEGNVKDGHLVLKAFSKEDSSTGPAELDVDGNLKDDQLTVTLTERRGTDGKAVGKWDLSGKKR